MNRIAAVFTIVIGVAAAALANANTFTLNKGVIVHLFEWKYIDIAEECEEFLGPNGFAGVQISPPSENYISEHRYWWERYQPVSYKLITRSGDEDQLAEMMRRCNQVGVRIFPDVVFNHMTGSGSPCIGTGGSPCDGVGLSYSEVPYTKDNFHHPICEIKDYNNATEVRKCELSGLHDLDQSQEYVRKKIVDYLNHLIDLGAAGFRVDAAKHMDPDDLSIIYSRLKHLNTDFNFPANTKPLIYQEVIDPGNEAVKFQEYTHLGLVTDFRYGNELGRCFQGWNDLKWLQNFGEAWSLIPNDESVVFIENHDTERDGKNNNIITYKKSRSYKMAVSFMLAWPHGTPKLLSSYMFEGFNQGPPQNSITQEILSPRPINGNVCSNGWVCQHRWRQIYNMVKFHNTVQGNEITSFWNNGPNQIAFCRGNKGFIAFNLEDYDLQQTLQTCLPEGSYCDVISGNREKGLCTGKTVSVAADGTAEIHIGKFKQDSPDDGVLAIHVEVTPFVSRRRLPIDFGNMPFFNNIGRGLLNMKDLRQRNLAVSLIERVISLGLQGGLTTESTIS